MSEASTRKEATNDVASGKPDAKQERERSKIEFPYTALDLAIILAKAVHDLGSQCDWGQLGAKLDMAADGGGFRQRLMAAKTFGLITYTSRTVSITPLGSRINEPDQVAAAKVESFLTVPLYKAVYEQYRTGMLPGAEGLENAMVNLGVAQKQKDKARQAFQRSATEAGFFASGTNRLVQPVLKPGKQPHTPELEVGAETTKEEPGNGNKGGGGGEPPHSNPLILGMINKLPADDAEWSMDLRKKWLQLAISVFENTYTTAPNDNGELSISLKTSAN